MAADSDSLHRPLLKDERYGDTPDEFGINSVTNDNDVPPIATLKQFGKESWVESRKLWGIAGPAIFTAICQYSLGAITQTFAGHLGTIELAAVSLQSSAIGGLGYGFMLGMGSALETLCGQAFGAGQIHMLGVYMQRSWIIMTVTALLLSLIYIFATPILKLLGQTADISERAGVFSIWMLPELFVYALNFPVQKFLQSQSKVMAMAWISAFGLIFHVFLSWLCIFKLGWGLAGAAFTLNLSWWMVVLGQLVYAVRCCPGAWTGLSWLAFHDLWAFVRLSLASAVMLCLEFWYFMTLIVLTGHLSNAEIEIDSISICMNLDGWEAMIFIGFNAAISVRVSNELGAGHPRAAKFSIIIVVATALLIGVIFMGVVLLSRDKIAVIFTDSKEVMAEVSSLATLLAVTMLLNSVQLVLSGVAIGGGWQALIAYINIVCYYVAGIPLGFLLGYKFNFGAKGIWSGLMGGVGLQTFIIFFITYFTNWDKEVSEVRDHLNFWGRSVEALKDGLVKAVIFTDSKEVMAEVSSLATLLAVTMLLNSVQLVLSGVAIGGGWQALIAYINIVCYYVTGIPLGFLLGYKFNFGAKGIWSGLMGGVGLQTFIIFLITYFTNWDKEVSEVRDHLNFWGRSVEALKDGLVKDNNGSQLNNQHLNV